MWYVTVLIGAEGPPKAAKVYPLMLYSEKVWGMEV